jgi:general secretion pathway protein M
MASEGRMNQLKTLLKDTLIQFWDERQQRERQIIIAAGAILVVMLIYLIGIDPALTGAKELRKSLPNLHLQAAEMQSMAQELASLPSPENLHDVSRDFIEQSLSRNSLKTSSLSVVEGVVRVQIDSTSMAALQTWLLEMQKSSGLFVEEIKITALEEGLVSTNITLRQASRG